MLEFDGYAGFFSSIKLQPSGCTAQKRAFFNVLQNIPSINQRAKPKKTRISVKS